jgi:hypothetical protein
MDRVAEKFEVEEGVTSGDYLQGFLRGTRRGALRGRARFHHAQHSTGRRISRRRADRALLMRGRVLRLTRTRQRLPSTKGGEPGTEEFLRIE